MAGTGDQRQYQVNTESQELGLKSETRDAAKSGVYAVYTEVYVVAHTTSWGNS